MSTPEFISHLEELRKRLFFSLITIIVCAAACYFFSDTLLLILTEPLRGSGEATHLYFHTPYEAFLAHLKIALLAGVLIASPLWIAEIWLFVAPALYEKEKKTILPLILSSAALFVIGAAFAFFIVIPWGIGFLLGFQSESLRPLLAVAPYLSFLFGMVMAFGLLFDLPVFMVGLVRLGVIRTAAVKKSRKIVIVGIFVIAAVLTPSPDPISQLLLAVPLWILFEISLLVAVFAEKKRA